MKGSGRFVAINACAKGIVSAIAHLVLATKVQQQASPQSVLAANQVTSLAKQVQASTGEVIAATQQAQSLEENSCEYIFTTEVIVLKASMIVADVFVAPIVKFVSQKHVNRKIVSL